MSKIVVRSSEVIDSAIGKLTRLNAQFESTSSDVINRQGALTNKWTGPASTQFQESFLKEKDNFQKFSDAINEYIKALTQILNNYEDAEGRNVSTASTRGF